MSGIRNYLIKLFILLFGPKITSVMGLSFLDTLFLKIVID